MFKVVLFTLFSLLTLSAAAQKISHIYDFNDVTTSVRKGNDVWVGSYVGILQRDAHTLAIKQYYNEINSGLLSNRVNCLAVKNNEIWIGTSKGISIFDGATFRSIVTPDAEAPEIYGLTHTSKGKTLALTTKGLWEIVDGKFQEIVLTNTIAQLKGLGLNEINDFWTTGFSSNCYPVLMDLKKELKLADSLAPYCPIFFSNRNELFTGSYNGILTYQNGNWKRLSKLKGNTGVPDFVREDKTGRIWFDADNDVGIYENGTVRWLKEQLSPELQDVFTFASRTEGVLYTNQFHDVTFDDQDIPWLIMSNGLLNCRTKSFHAFPNGRLEFGDQVNTYWQKDALTIITRFQSIQFANNTFTLVKNDPNTEVSLSNTNQIAADGTGAIWISGSSITRVKNSRHLDLNLTPDIYTKFIQEDQFGRVWLSSQGNLVAFDSTTLQHTISSDDLGNPTPIPAGIPLDTAIAFVSNDRIVLAGRNHHRIIKFYKRISWFSTAIYDKRTKGFWIAGDSLYYFDGKSLVTKGNVPIARGDKFPNQAPVLFHFNDDVWAFSSRNTLLKCSNTAVEEFGLERGVGRERVYSYAVFQNQIVLSHAKGSISVFKDKRWRNVLLPQGLDANEMSRGVVDAKGALLFPGGFGKPTLLRFDGTTFKQVTLVADPTAQIFIYHLFKEGAQLVAVTSAGIFFVGPELNVVRDSSLTGTELKIPQVVNGVVLGLANEKLAIYKNKTWTYLDASNGLFSSTPFMMSPIGHNKIAVHFSGAFTILDFK